MEIINGKIAKATLELYNYYLTREWYMVMSFRDWLRRCEEAGTNETDDEDEKK